MEKNLQTPPLNKVRRSERIQDEAWIRQFLLASAMGTMATAVEGQPFLVTRNYAYDQARHAIYMHGAIKGRTYENVGLNNRVCFSVSEMGRLLPADEALEVGVEYAGVVLFGRVFMVEDLTEARHGLQLLLDKYFSHLKSGRDYAPITPEALKITAVYRLDIESWSGKAKVAPPDFPGAFTFGAFPLED
jgi:nitroimidazol reductase NimA-like FMN-containing flavoprotein (pyridoxamine 5'-phosphate oxidase superfamily)